MTRELFLVFEVVGIYLIFILLRRIGEDTNSVDYIRDTKKPV